MHVGYSSFGYGNYATPSKNMIKKINSQEQGGPVTFYTNYEYEYNDKGYPTKLTISGGDNDGNGIPDLFVYNYTYQCK